MGLRTSFQHFVNRRASHYLNQGLDAAAFGVGALIAFNEAMQHDWVAGGIAGGVAALFVRRAVNRERDFVRPAA